MTERYWAVVPAAGVGSRMQADRPKQYLELLGEPVIQHTLRCLATHPQICGVVVSVSEQDPYWQTIDFPSDWPVFTVVGGKERVDSVFNALLYLQKNQPNNSWVLVHDAARPCLRHEDIDRMIAHLKADDIGGILGVPVSETVKRVNAQQQICETVDRENLWRAATPQMFRLQPLIQAIEATKLGQCVITDEASAMEYAGFQPKMIEGHPDNIKITVRQDLPLAALFLQQQKGIR